MYSFKKVTSLKFLFFALLLCGCSPILAQKDLRTPTVISPTNNALPTLEIVLTPEIRLVGGAELASRQPGEPHGPSQVIHDQSSVSTALQKKAFGGDDYTLGKYERPFNQQMEYLPGLDIVRAEMNRPGDGWLYISIITAGPLSPPPSVYGVELDTDIDGRGDLLIQIHVSDSGGWTERGSKTWWDSDGDVGGVEIARTDPNGFRGSGFETLKTDSDRALNPGKIWSRIFAEKANTLQIAVSEELVGGKSGKFSWRPYTDGVPFPPTQYYLNDYYPLEIAGSAILGERDYPLKAVYAIDNTCRRLSGLDPSGVEQGVCPP